MESLFFWQMVGVTGLFGVALGALGARVVVPWLGESRGRLEPAVRIRRLMLWAAAPLLVGAGLLGATLLPGLLHQLGVAADHCSAHGHHFHICPVHGFHGHHPSLLWVPLAAAGLWMSWHLAAGLRDWMRTSSRLRQLGATWDEELGVYRVADSRVFALSGGLLRPATYLSDGAIEQLDETQLQVVLAHETSHADGGHALMKWAASLLGRLHLPATRRHLNEQLELACEQHCDERAAEEAGDPLSVAETIVAVRRMLEAERPLAPGAGAHGFGDGVLEARVRGLLDDEWRRPGMGGPLVVAAISTLVVVGMSEPIHHLVETVLAWIL